MNLIDTNLGLNKDNLSFAEKSTKQILHGIAQKAVYGGNLESILATSAGNVAFDYIGHSVYSNDSQFPQLRDAIPKTVIHSLVGGTLAELAGGDFSQGAIATTTSHLVAEYYLNTKLEALKNGDKSSTLNDKQLMAITDAIGGAIVLATHEKVSDEDLKIAQGMSHSVVENNVVPIIAAVEAVSATMTTAEIAVLGSAISSLGAVAVYNIIKDNPDNIVESLSLAVKESTSLQNDASSSLSLAISQDNKVRNGRTGETGYEQDDGSIMVKDRAGVGHGGSAWKRYKNKKEWENKNAKREGTYDENGNRLRD